ncbi:hypothetical protein PGTUg99_029964 [Puccinia graminis f. sp. tritici]|uniref:Wings apart-like protein C-terminal domain-containing protein n=1 Tax=Puccinia graminis f. sp. tritici TaxID=56615 RepID=A0A5B0SLS0_PUCGR|nr:hypothetical protein PGTUg99_029964 [Puccinia graminis f. sp. tritici]
MHIPRIKFTYGNRKSRLKTLTQEYDSSDDDQDIQVGPSSSKLLDRLTANTTTQQQAKKNQTSKKEIPSNIHHSKKRKKTDQEPQNTITATNRRVSDRLKSNPSNQETTTSQPQVDPNRETTPLDQDLLLILQVQKPQTSSARPSRARSVNQSPQSIKKPHLQPTQCSSPQRVVNKRPRTESKTEQDRKALPGPELPQRRITRSLSQRSLVPSEPTSRPIRTELNYPFPDQRDEHFSSPTNSPHHQSPQPPGSDTPDHSDIFAILESIKACNDSEGAELNGSPKKARVALMGGKTISRSGALSPSLSSGCSRPTSPIARPANRLLKRVLSTSSCSDLFGSSNRTSNLPPRKPLARQLSSDFPPIPVNHEVINTSNLVNIFPGGKALKKTYGGERTFKQDENELKLLMPISTPAPPRTSKRLSGPTAGSSRLTGSLKRFQSRETYSELRKKWGVDEDDEPIEDETELQTTIHQRASGSSKRFTDELFYLIEGLVSTADQPDLSLKRSSAVELIKKLKEQQFMNELRSNGLIEHFYNSFRSAGAGDGDPILDHALLIFISLLSCQDQKFIEPVLRIIPKGSTGLFSMQSDCLQVLGTVACRKYPQPTLKPRGTSRRHPPLVTQIQEVIQESILRKHLPGASSPGLLALFSLARIAMFVPRPGLLPQRSIVHCSAFASAIDCLKVYSQKLHDLFDNSVSFPDFSTGDGHDILKHVGFCMDVIEACTVCEEDALNSINLFRDPLASVFGSLISLCHSLARHDQTKISMTALDILIGCLRTMVNVTNYNSIWASELSTPSVLHALCGLFGICREGYDHHQSTQKAIKRAEDRIDPPSVSPSLINHPQGPHAHDNRVDDVVFDLLCVSLGLLANLLEQSTQATDMLRETRIQQPDRRSSMTVSKPNQHFKSSYGFEELIRLYIDPPCGKLDEKKFIRGSISVLINLTLLNGYEDANVDLEDDTYQSVNELEIIKSFKRVLDQVGFNYVDDHCDEEKGHEGTGEVTGLDVGRENGKLATKNEIIKSFLADLKLHSGATSASSSLSVQDQSISSSLPTDRQSNTVDHLTVLAACWNRLRVELI